VGKIFFSLEFFLPGASFLSWLIKWSSNKITEVNEKEQLFKCYSVQAKLLQTRVFNSKSDRPLVVTCSPFDLEL